MLKRGTRTRCSFAPDSNPLVMRVIHNPTLPVFGLLTAFLLVAQGLWAQEVFLNEVDADSYTVPDSLEFVELFGAPNQPLDGHIVVFTRGRKRSDVHGLCGV